MNVPPKETMLRQQAELAVRFRQLWRTIETELQRLLDKVQR